jgi:hypothetical protein
MHSSFQAEATKTNALVEASLAGGWLCLACWLAGLILMILQKHVLKQQKKEFDRQAQRPILNFAPRGKL